MRELLWDEMNAVEAKWTIEKRFRVVEVFLAVLCFSSAYLAFFFTDCLMSRWLLNYTPQATIVRLLTINLINAYTTSWILYLSGGSGDPRLLLPAWICIASHGQFIISVVSFKNRPSAATIDSAYGRDLGTSNSNEERRL
ncbi:hypothetical protein BELL_0085g00050 [Botrytis elliptica]|uniref:Uncharacterized protein n=1 Tax=Botrytis elliptica TaxID=278938 RepID=A0A4Z1K988_9HELO|nr:hypothetical protein BELL_0085g00050 [Botrytis elliptica]